MEDAEMSEAAKYLTDHKAELVAANDIPPYFESIVRRIDDVDASSDLSPNQMAAASDLYDYWFEYSSRTLDDSHVVPPPEAVNAHFLAMCKHRLEGARLFDSTQPRWLATTQPPTAVIGDRASDPLSISLAEPDPPTRRYQGESNQCDSIIDLALLNDTALCTGRFSPISISFHDSLGSDHAILTVYRSPPYEPLPYVPSILLGFVLNHSLMDSWSKDLSLLPTPPISSLASLVEAVDSLDADI